MIRVGSVILAAQQPSKRIFRSALIAIRLNQNIDHVRRLLCEGSDTEALCPLLAAAIHETSDQKQMTVVTWP